MLLTIEGIDDTTSQPLIANYQWGVGDVRWNHRYVDLVRRGEDGINVIDYSTFHDVLPLDVDGTPGG